MTTFLMNPPAPTAEQMAKVEQMRDAADRARQSAEDSFQRCDTDGFLSQWASGMTSQLYRAEMAILENGGHVAMRVLCDEEGNIVSDRIAHFPHPVAHWTTVAKWDLGRGCEGRRWVPTGSKSRVQKQMGLREEIRWVPGYAKVTAPAGARGLGGAASAYIGRFRSDTHEQV